MSSEPAFVSDRAALEAEAAGNAVVAADTPAVTPAPGRTSAQVERDILAAPRKTPADEAREAIYARAAANRGNIDESETAMNMGVRAMLEATGEMPTGVPINPGAEPVTARPLDRTQDMVTIHVEGREFSVPASQVLEAGRATLQKETSADYRLQRVALAERQILEERASLDRRSAEIEALRAATPTGASAPTARTDLPSGGTGATEGTEQALTALLDSDVKGAAQQLSRIVAETVRAEVKAMGMSAQPAVAAAPSVSEADRAWPQATRDGVNRQVIASFPQIARNPTLAQHFTARLANEMANPTNIAGRVDLGEMAGAIANEILHGPTRVVQPPQPVANGSADELAQRRTLAARVPGVPMPSATRSVNPAPGPAPKTRSDIVNDMKKARGQA